MRRNALAPLLALLCVALGPLRCSASEQASGSFLPLYHTNNDPLAVCNDGSPAGFYFSPANDTSKSNLWLVYLEGGQWCYDADSCAQRQVLFPYLTSSWPWYHHLRMGGIFDADPRRSPWAGANLVFIGYCSSDAWVGDVGPESNSWGWSFRGQRIIASVFAALSYGVDVTTTETVHFPNKTHAKVTDTVTYKLGTAPKVLFAGCSAGSRGAMFNLDYVQDMLPPGAPPVLGFFDSPMWVDVQPFEPGTMPLENETMAVYNLVNATARIPPACAAAYPGAEGWKCLYGQYRIPFVQTPYLMSASQFDKYQLPYNEGSMPPWNASALAYATEFQAAVRDVMLNLPTKAQPRSAIYSSACFKHCTSTLAWGSFWGVKIDNLSLKDYLGMWYFGSSDPDQQNDDTGQQGSMPPSMSPQRIEACNGFGCGQCHKKLVAPAPPLPPTYAMSLVPGQTATRHRHLPSARHEKRSGLPHVIALVMLCAVGVGALAAARRQMAGPARARSAAGAVKEVPLGEASPLLRKPPAASTAAAPAFETKYAALGEAAAKQLAAAKPQAAKPKAAPPPAEPAAAASKAAPAVAAPKAAPAAAAPAPAPAAAAQAAAAAAAGAAEAKAAAAKRAVDEAAANKAAEEAAAARKAAEVAAQKAAADAAANKAAAEAAANKAAAEAATQQAAVAAAAAQSAATEAAAQKAGAEEVVQQAASQAAAKKAAEEAAAAQQIAAAAAAAQQAVEAAAAETPAEAAGESDDEIDRALARAVAEEAASLLHEVDTGTSAGSTAETAETPAAAAGP